MRPDAGYVRTSQEVPRSTANQLRAGRGRVAAGVEILVAGPTPASRPELVRPSGGSYSVESSTDGERRRYVTAVTQTDERHTPLRTSECALSGESVQFHGV